MYILFICLFAIICHHTFRPFKSIRFQEQSSSHPVTYGRWASKSPPSCWVVFQGQLWQHVAFNSVGILSFSCRDSILRSSKMSSFLFWPAIRCNGFTFAAGVHFYVAVSYSNTIHEGQKSYFVQLYVFIYLFIYLFIQLLVLSYR
jgi:hypothetical protein